MASNVLYDFDPVVVKPSTKHSATVVILHGLGDTSDGWVGVTDKTVWAQNLPYVKFILPTAPVQPVTWNNRMRMTAWFDINSLHIDTRKEDEKGVNATYRYLTDLVEKEVQNGIDSERIVIAGYSQGGAIALSMLRSPHKLAGIIGMSCFLPQLKETPIVSEENKDTPVLLCHGIFDPTVAFEYGRKSYEILREQLKEIEFKEYPVPHAVHPDELVHTREFLEKVLPPI